jgi:hypothetical protein
MRPGFHAALALAIPHLADETRFVFLTSTSLSTTHHRYQNAPVLVRAECMIFGPYLMTNAKAYVQERDAACRASSKTKTHRRHSQQEAPMNVKLRQSLSTRRTGDTASVAPTRRLRIQVIIYKTQIKLEFTNVRSPYSAKLGSDLTGIESKSSIGYHEDFRTSRDDCHLLRRWTSADDILFRQRVTVLPPVRER